MYTVHTEFSDGSKNKSFVQDLPLAKEQITTHLSLASRYTPDDYKMPVFTVLTNDTGEVLDGFVFVGEEMIRVSNR